MAENAPYVFRKQMAVTQKFGTDCRLRIPSWALRPRHRTRRSYTVSYLLSLVSICYRGKMPGHKLLKAPGTKKSWFSMSSEHNRANILLFPARILVLLLYHCQALCYRGVVLRQCCPDTVIVQIISLQKWQIGNVLNSLFCSWLPLILVTWNLAQSIHFRGLWTFGGMAWQTYRQSWSFFCWKWEF